MNITSNMCCLHPLSSLCVACVFILLIFSLSIADLTYIVPQATAYTNTFGSSLNVLNTQSHDSNQNLIAQTVAKIYFERSGGFAGISSSAVVDIQSLPADEANKIQGMIDNAKGFFYQPSKLTPAPPQAADYFKYKITVQTEEGTQNTIETNDITMPSELRPLINNLVNLLPKSSK